MMRDFFVILHAMAAEIALKGMMSLFLPEATRVTPEPAAATEEAAGEAPARGRCAAAPLAVRVN